MKENMPPGAVVLGDVKTSKSHNKEQDMENSMKGRGYDPKAKDLEKGYVETDPPLEDGEYHIGTGSYRMIY